ncbi:chemotaxis protein [Escherichia coli]|nr:chemotaxis protein [Escherichia coli]EEV5558900.1 chemotaxis protein [Escherichia coli]EEV6162602.1 chemotaxis protein [Escherichia coli]EEW2580601.1 chemotaxis protein [Escherichia coli]EEY3913881.1 chemotaxis protein [Escherichia coli]
MVWPSAQFIIKLLIRDPLVYVTNGAIVIHTQRLKSDPGGNLLS